MIEEKDKQGEAMKDRGHQRQIDNTKTFSTLSGIMCRREGGSSFPLEADYSSVRVFLMPEAQVKGQDCQQIVLLLTMSV